MTLSDIFATLLIAFIVGIVVLDKLPRGASRVAFLVVISILVAFGTTRQLVVLYADSLPALALHS